VEKVARQVRPNNPLQQTAHAIGGSSSFNVSPAAAAGEQYRSAETPMLESVEIHGDPPEASGRVCEALLAEQYCVNGRPVEEVDAIFLKVAGRWHSLDIDCGIIFWDQLDARPEGEPPGPEIVYALVDLGQMLGLNTQVLDRVEAFPREDGGSEVLLTFRDGATLVFANNGDDTTYHLIRPSALSGLSSPLDDKRGRELN
jgi:hypothetical protein